MNNQIFPIFRAALELCSYMETIVKRFDKYHKYTIGEDMRNFSKKNVRVCVVEPRFRVEHGMTTYPTHC